MVSNEQVKNVIVVDDDIDIYNQREVDWALSYRFQAENDLIVLPGLKGSPIDPSAQLDGFASVTSKMGFDATMPIADRERFEKIDLPQEAKEKARRIYHGCRG